MASIFERLNRNRPAPPPEEKAQVDPAQRLLTWLPRWPRDTITVRQIRVYGPHCLKGRMDAINAAEVLVANGFLTSTKAQRPDTYAWRIIRKNILNPTVGM